jgi:hypothetical protein
MERITKQINKLKDTQVKNLCDEIGHKFHIDHKKLFDLWCLMDGECNKNKSGCKVTHSKVYDSNVVRINEAVYLIFKDGVFGKVSGDDVIPITIEDEKICIFNGYKVVNGIFNEEFVGY